MKRFFWPVLAAFLILFALVTLAGCAAVGPQSGPSAITGFSLSIEDQILTGEITLSDGMSFISQVPLPGAGHTEGDHGIATSDLDEFGYITPHGIEGAMIGMDDETGEVITIQVE